MKSKRKGRLSIKAAIYCTVFAVILTAIISGLSYLQTRETVDRLYAQYAETLVKMLSAGIDVNMLGTAIETGVVCDEMLELQGMLNTAYENSRTQYIYIINFPDGLDSERITYVMFALEMMDFEAYVESVEQFLRDIEEDPQNFVDFISGEIKWLQSELDSGLLSEEDSTAFETELRDLEDFLRSIQDSPQNLENAILENIEANTRDMEEIREFLEVGVASWGRDVEPNEFSDDVLQEIRSTLQSGETGVFMIIDERDSGDVNDGTQDDSLVNLKIGYTPLIDDEGNLVAVLGVDISMDIILDEINSSFRNVVMTAIIPLVVFLSIFLSLIIFRVVRPIKNISDSAEDFVQQTHVVSDPTQFQYNKVAVKSKDEIGLLSDSVNHMVSELLRYMVDMKTMSLDKERTAAELDVASRIRLDLYPTEYPAFPLREDFDVFAKLEPATTVGGDFYNFFMTDSDHLYLMIGTVSGSGIATTMLSAIITTLIKSYARLGYIPARILSETNNELSRNNIAEFDAELFLAAIDLRNGEVGYATAGDIRPFHKASGSSFEKMPGKVGIKLGLLENVPYSQSEINLSQGEMLFMFTRGLPDATDENGYTYSEEYAVERLAAIMHEEVKLDKIVQALGEDVARFRGEGEQTIENTMLLFRYYGT